MIAPPAPAAPRRRRTTVTVVALLVVVAGAFVWGLGMFAVGHATARASQSTIDQSHEATILIQMMHIDQALAQQDGESAAALIEQLSTSADPQVEAMLRIRRHQMRDLEAASSLKRQLASSLQQRSDADLHLIAMDCVSDDGNQLLGISLDATSGRYGIIGSKDGGRTWLDDDRFTAAGSGGLICPAFVTNPAFPKELLLLSAQKGRHLGWWSHDGGGTFASVPYPGIDQAGQAAAAPPGFSEDAVHTDICDGRAWLGGGTSLTIAMTTMSGRQACCWHTSGSDHGWQAGGLVTRVLALVPHDQAIRIYARDNADQVLVSDDDGMTYHGVPGDVTALPPQHLASTWPMSPSVARRLFLTEEHGFALPADEHVVALAWVKDSSRWYLLGRRHGLWRSDDDGSHWLAGRGALGQLRAHCLSWIGGATGHLLIGGDGLWTFTDQERPTLFCADSDVTVSARVTVFAQALGPGK